MALPKLIVPRSVRLRRFFPSVRPPCLPVHDSLLPRREGDMGGWRDLPLSPPSLPPSLLPLPFFSQGILRALGEFHQTACGASGLVWSVGWDPVIRRVGGCESLKVAGGSS